MPNYWKVDMKKTIAILSFLGILLSLSAQASDSNCTQPEPTQTAPDSISEIDRVITEGKLEAAEFDYHLQQMKRKVHCLLIVQRELGLNSVEPKDGDPKSVFAQITEVVGIYELKDSWKEIENRYSLKEVRRSDAELDRFIKVFPETRVCQAW